MSKTQTRRPRAETAPEPDAEPDVDPDAPDEDTPPPETPPDEEPSSIEQQARKIDNARRKYRRDLVGIIGDLEGASDCPYCDGMGLVPDEAAFLKRDDVDACPVCQGRGFMFTGSAVADHRLLPCPKCVGTGYQAKQPENVHTLPAPTVPQAAPAQQVHGWFDPVTQTFHPYGETAGTA